MYGLIAQEHAKLADGHNNAMKYYGLATFSKSSKNSIKDISVATHKSKKNLKPNIPLTNLNNLSFTKFTIHNLTT